MPLLLGKDRDSYAGIPRINYGILARAATMHCKICDNYSSVGIDFDTALCLLVQHIIKEHSPLLMHGR